MPMGRLPWASWGVEMGERWRQPSQSLPHLRLSRAQRSVAYCLRACVQYELGMPSWPHIMLEAGPQLMMIAAGACAQSSQEH